jgi:ubiquinone/menaquinone biosynthesis C-methylase UbiE
MAIPVGDSIGRFDGLADVYDRCRPDYPAAAIEHILNRCGLVPGNLLIDIGCGTGISSRQMASAAFRVIGIEPNPQMRASAESAGSPGNPIEYRDGRAAATGLPDSSGDAVLAAQALHWFANEVALKEFYRILKASGWLALMWNEQDRNDPFTVEYMRALVRHSPNPALAGEVHSSHGEFLRSSPLFHRLERVEFQHQQEMALDELLGRAFSASYAPKAPEPSRRLTEELSDLQRRFQKNGRTTLRYKTVVYSAVRL